MPVCQFPGASSYTYTKQETAELQISHYFPNLSRRPEASQRYCWTWGIEGRMKMKTVSMKSVREGGEWLPILSEIVLLEPSSNHSVAEACIPLRSGKSATFCSKFLRLKETGRGLESHGSDLWKRAWVRRYPDPVAKSVWHPRLMSTLLQAAGASQLWPSSLLRSLKSKRWEVHNPLRYSEGLWQRMTFQTCR